MKEGKSGSIVYQRIQELGIKQNELGEAIGVSQARISQWLRGHSIPTDRIIRKLAKRLDMDYESLRIVAERERLHRECKLLRQKYSEVLEEFPDLWHSTCNEGCL